MGCDSGRHGRRIRPATGAVIMIDGDSSRGEPVDGLSRKGINPDAAFAYRRLDQFRAPCWASLISNPGSLCRNSCYMAQVGADLSTILVRMGDSLAEPSTSAARDPRWCCRRTVRSNPDAWCDPVGHWSRSGRHSRSDRVRYDRTRVAFHASDWGDSCGSGRIRGRRGSPNTANGHCCPLWRPEPGESVVRNPS